MEDFGLVTDDPIPADGKLHRLHIRGDKPRSRNGWVVLHSDPPAGAFGCWKRGITHTWSAKPNHPLTPGEKEAYRAKIEAAMREREREQERIRAKARDRAKQIWTKAEPADPNHPYLIEKAVGAYGVRQSRGSLVIPVRDSAGELQGLQFIDGDGSKTFLTGTNKKGSYHPIGRPQDVLLVAEGYATAASLHEATGYASAVAFDAGNLKPVAEALRTKFPDIILVVCGDNDHKTEGNPGARYAREAAESTGGRYLIPEFREVSK